VFLEDLVYIGDSLTNLKATSRTVLIFKIPQTNRGVEYFMPADDYAAVAQSGFQ
jgi:hypothetical protein